MMTVYQARADIRYNEVMKTYLVTGISRGLGMAVAELLLDAGHDVYGTYNTNKDAAEQLKVKQPKLTIVQADFATDGGVKAVIEAIGDTKLDGIVNSAGVFIDIDFTDFDKQAFEDTFKVNAFTPLYLVQSLQANLQNGGSIVNVSSTDAMIGSIVGLAYSASKAALQNLSQSLANILSEKKIRSNAVALGWMGDGMQAPEKLLELAADLNPLDHVASYKEVAEVVVFLLSDKASYVNGTTVTIDGGDMATSYILQKEAEM